MNRSDYVITTNEICDFFSRNNLFPISEDDITLLSTKEQKFIDFLFEEEFLFKLNGKRFKDNFPVMSLNSEFPFSYKYSTIFVQYLIEQFSFNDFNETIQTLVRINCIRLTMVFLCKYQFNDILRIIECLNINSIASLELYIEDNNESSNEILQKLFLNFPFITKLVICNSKFTEKHKLLSVFWIENNIKESLEKRMVDPAHFKVNYELFKMSKNYNVHYHSRLIINSSGKIFEDYRLLNTEWSVNNLDKYRNENNNISNISKDNILICKDCEYRYMCQDTSVPIINEDGKYEREFECNYNPYITEWSKKL